MNAQPATTPPVLRAHRGGPDAPLTVTKPARDLHVSAAVLALPGLSLLARVLLADILDLYKCTGSVFAKDDYFADRLGSKPRTVREAIADLEAAGHLTRVVNYTARHKRLLTPTDLWQNPPGLVADSAGTCGRIRRD